MRAIDEAHALGAPLTADVATHIYLAVLTDTGSFHFSHLTPRTYELAGRAVAACADPGWIARTHYDSNSLAAISCAACSRSRRSPGTRSPAS